MNAEEAGLALNVVELGLLVGAGYFIYQKVFYDPETDVNAPEMIKMIYAFHQIQDGDYSEFINKYQATMQEAVEYVADNAQNDSQTQSITEKIGRYAMGVGTGALREALSSFDPSENPTQDEWVNSDSVKKQIYDATCAEIHLIITATAKWTGIANKNTVPLAKAAVLQLIDSRWQSGFAPPLWTDSDIASIVYQFKLDRDMGDDLANYAGQIATALTYRTPPKQYIKEVDDYLANLYTFAVQYVTGWTVPRSFDWQTWEPLEAYRYMPDLVKLGANQDTVASCMFNIYQLTNKNYGSADYATGADNALATYVSHAKSMLQDSVLHPKPTCDYDYDSFMAYTLSWGAPDSVLSLQARYAAAVDVLTLRNSLYGQRWASYPNTPPPGAPIKGT